MSATILETLTSDDLKVWRDTAAEWDMVRYASPALQLDREEVLAIYHRYYATAASLLAEYGIDAEESVEAQISTFTGHIFIGQGE